MWGSRLSSYQSFYALEQYSQKLLFSVVVLSFTLKKESRLWSVLIQFLADFFIDWETASFQIVDVIFLYPAFIYISNVLCSH